MSVKNLVQCPLITPVSSTATELLLGAVSAPYSLPPLDGGILVISDSPSKPSFVEFIKYTHRIDNVLYGVSRGQEETAARAWSGVTYVYQALTADQYTSELASKEPVIPPGTTAQYWRGDKSFQDLATAIRAANLTGFSTATNAAVVSTDTLLAALGKLQAQMNVRLLSTANAVSASKLQTARTISVAGDATGSLTFDGTANVSMDVSLQPSGVTAGTYTKLTVDSKGRVTGGTILLVSDVPTLNQDTTGNAGTATKLQTSRTINGVVFDGTANVVIADDTKEPAFAAGTTAQYRRGDKTWQDFATAVRASVMTGLSTATNAAVAATDTLLAAIGKLQAQITGLDSTKLDATANAVSATKLQTARSIALAGDVTGSATFDGSANVSITATVADDSHNHTIANVDGLQNALDAKAPLASPPLTGVPTAPTNPSPGTSTTQLATTAFVQSVVNGYLSKAVTGGTVVLTADEAANAVINLSGTLTSALIIEIPVTANRIYSISNNTTGAFATTVRSGPTGAVVAVAQGKRNLVYTNTSGAYDAINDFESIALTGTPTAPTAAVGTNTTQVATTAFVNAEIANDAPSKTGTGASGSWGISVTGNAATATKLATARTLSLAGDVTGSATFDGSANAAITATVTNDSHSHSTSTITGLGTAATKNITISTAAPSGGADGDLWIQY